MKILDWPVFKSPWLFWGALDAFLVVDFISRSLGRGRIPYVSDVLGALTLVDDFGWGHYALAVLAVVVHVSVIFSAVLLLKERRAGIYLSLAQIPFRLVFVLPSFSLLLVWARFSPGYSSWLMGALLLSSEIAKTRSLWRMLKTPRSAL
ncbi:hypothetical protein [Pseudomonas sp. zfem002]|uniref:hypothetical protein n=1 Tax=Pseudomonas sp. zfem002 TaxID=3078197 RepID=UPI00292A0C2B|nr:hypothetical protein [Pseudomonas sp. zfem002]MDU9391762.1 hypothetical protein [Pseudomonas sp. zfem002]